jgi:hypothetical protein
MGMIPLVGGLVGLHRMGPANSTRTAQPIKYAALSWWPRQLPSMDNLAAIYILVAAEAHHDAFYQAMSIWCTAGGSISTMHNQPGSFPHPQPKPHN